MPNPSLNMTELDKKSDDLIHLCTLRLQFVGKTCKTLATQGLTSGKRGGFTRQWLDAIRARPAPLY